MTRHEAIKIAAAIRAYADKDIGDDWFAPHEVRDALTEIAGVVADVYAATQRAPESAKQAFMRACGL